VLAAVAERGNVLEALQERRAPRGRRRRTARPRTTRAPPRHRPEGGIRRWVERRGRGRRGDARCRRRRGDGPAPVGSA